MARSRIQPVDVLALVAIVALALGATRSVWLEIIRVGLSSEEQSHILLAPLVALWLAWLRRGRLRYCDVTPSPWGPPAILIGWALSSFGFRTGVDIAWHLGALLVVAGAVIAVIGHRCIRQFLPTCLALLFLLPVPGRVRQHVAVPLQQATAQVGEWAMQILGVPVERMGIALTVNGNTVAVAEACNGMRMISALALIAFAFVFSTPMRNSVRLVILAATPLLAILVNLFRLIPTVLLFAYAPKSVASAFHDLSGWASLVVALALLWTLLKAMRWLEIPIARVAVATT